MNQDSRLKNKRKFSAFILALLCATALNVWGSVDSDTIGVIFGALIWAYMVGNVGEHASKAIGKKINGEQK